MISIDDDETIQDEEESSGNLKMAVAGTNTRKKMRYSRKIGTAITAIFIVFAIGNMTLFITPGVREFVQQYRLVYVFVPLPIVSRILISVVERLHSHQLLLFLAFLAHLLSIFLSITSLSLFFDTEIVYFICFTISLNMFQLVLYTFQTCSIFSTFKMSLFVSVLSLLNALFLQILLSIFNFPFFLVILVSVLVSIYIHINITHFMTIFSSSDWFLATVHVFTRIPMKHL